MTEEAQALKNFIAEHRELKNLEPFLNRIPSQEEFDASCAFMEAEFESLFNYDVLPAPAHPLSRPLLDKAPAPSLPGSHPVSIRIPRNVIAVFKAEAKKRGVPYQTLMKRALRAQVIDGLKETYL